MCKESTLENKIKITDAKVQKLFILTLYKIQNKVNTALELLEESDDTLIDQTPEENAEQIKHEDDEEISDFDITHDSDNLDNFPTVDSVINKTPDSKLESKKKVNTLLKDESKIEANINSSIDMDVNALNNVLEKEIENSENNEVDQIFEESILQLENENEDEDEDKSIITINKNPEYLNKLLTDKTLEDKFDTYLKEVTKFKLLTAQELRTLKKTFENRKQLKSPYNKDEDLDTFKQISSNATKLNKEDMELTIDNELIPNNLKKEVILNLDKKYINEIMQKDIVSCISNLEKAELIIKDYTIENDSSILGNYEIHRLTLKPLNGKESTVYFRLPKIDNEGEFTASGIRYRMRKQRTD
jgi:hypothetical protein